MTGLTLSEFSGSTTSSVNYTLQNITASSSYNGSFSSTDAGNNVFLPGFGAGTYNITFDLSGTEGITYKLTGTQVLDYVHQTQQQQTVYFNKIRIVDATGTSGHLETCEIQVWIDGSNVAKTATIEAYTPNGSISLNDTTTGICKLTNDNIAMHTWYRDHYQSANHVDRYIQLLFANAISYNDLDAVVLCFLPNSGNRMFSHKVEFYNGSTFLTDVNLYSLTSNNTSTDREFGSRFKGIVKLRGPNHIDTAQMRGNYYGNNDAITGSEYTNAGDGNTYTEPTSYILSTTYVHVGYADLVGTMVGDADDLTYVADIVYPLPTTAVAAYTTIAFDSNNGITIENAMPDGDVDNVTFTLVTGYEMAGLTLSEFTGSTTSSVNYTLQNITTDASYNGSFSLDDSGNNVFTPFGAGTYNITFDLSGTEGVTYKLTGTQSVDYITRLASSYYNDAGFWTANSTIDLSYVQNVLYYTSKITMNDEGTRLCALDNSYNSSLKVYIYDLVGSTWTLNANTPIDVSGSEYDPGISNLICAMSCDGRTFIFGKQYKPLQIYSEASDGTWSKTTTSTFDIGNLAHINYDGTKVLYRFNTTINLAIWDIPTETPEAETIDISNSSLIANFATDDCIYTAEDNSTNYRVINVYQKMNGSWTKKLEYIGTKVLGLHVSRDGLYCLIHDNGTVKVYNRSSVSDAFVNFTSFSKTMTDVTYLGTHLTAEIANGGQTLAVLGQVYNYDTENLSWFLDNDTSGNSGLSPF